VKKLKFNNLRELQEAVPLNQDYVYYDESIEVVKCFPIIKCDCITQLKDRIKGHLHTLLYLNPELTKNKLLGYILKVAKKNKFSLEENSLSILVDIALNRIKKGYEPTTIKKYFIFNINSKLTISEKKSIGAKLGRSNRKNKTYQIIKETLLEWKEDKISHTILSKKSEINRSTIIRHLKNNKRLSDIYDSILNYELCIIPQK